MNAKNLSEVISSSFVTLDSLQANVFIADLDLNLVYMNPKAIKTLKDVEHEIFKVFGLRVKDFIGVSILRFHQDPQGVEKILRSSSSLPNQMMIHRGEIHWEVLFNAITVPDGEIVGYILNWVEKSEQARMEEEMMKRIEELEMIESASNNF